MASKVSIRAYLNLTKAKGKLIPIYLRIIYNRQKAEYSTGLLTPVKEWDDSIQRTKKNTNHNGTINDLINKIYDAIKILSKENKPINVKLLKDIIKNKENHSYGILEYFQKHITQITKAGEIKKDSIRRYDDTYGHLVGFLREFKPNHIDLPLEMVDFNFLNEFDIHLNDFGLQRNTINKHHSRIRTILLKARNEGLISKYPYTTIKLRNTPTNRQALNAKEIKQIENANLSQNDSLDRVRDIFLFSLYTGLRFSDAQNLSTENLIKKSKLDWQISIVQQKTGDALFIPLLEPAKRIIRKYEKAISPITKRILPTISNQKTNTYLKVIADLAGIKKQITHHVARHTYATTILLSNQVPMEVVSRLLGHTNLRTTQIYAKVTNSYVFDSIKKLKLKVK